MNVKINIKDSILETNRLVLRPFKRSDLDDFYAYARFGVLVKWQDGFPINQLNNHKKF
ncbi:MAG: hypothetical protein ACLU5J_04960 [Christensenellales bacterium]